MEEKNNPSTVSLTSIAKFLHDDDCTTTTSQIPSVLVKSHGGVLPSEATFTIDDSGKSWKIKIEKFRDLYFFTDGWMEFAQDVDIKTRDYLLFNSPGLMSQFQVETNSHTDFFNSGDQTDNAENENYFTHQEHGPIDSSWSFMVELKSYNLNQLTIPRKLLKKTRAKPDGNLILQDVEGRKWTVRVTRRSCGKISITAGWSNFLIANRVVVGSTVSLKFISCSNNMVEARVVKEGTNRKALFSLVKRIGNEFVVCGSDGASGLSKGSGSSHKANEHVDGEESYCKARNHAEEPESSYKACNQAADHIAEYADEENGFGRAEELEKQNAREMPESFHKTSKLAEEPETSFKTSAHADVQDSTHKRSKFAKGLANIDLKIKSENEDQCPAETNSQKELNSGDQTEIADDEDGEVTDSSRKRTKYAKGLENIHLNIEIEDEDKCQDEENGFGVGRRWTFSKELKKHDAYKLDIPRDISKFIEKTTDGKIKLEDRKGQIWPVRIEHRKCGAYTMTAGWIDFLVGNRVCIGSTISFELIPNSDNVIKARVVDMGNVRNELFGKRAKGRPPCS